MRPTLGRERAYDYLRGILLNDPSLAGTFVNEQEVADSLGISRTPVREALLLLSAEDLVQLLPGRGALVPPLTPELIHHIIEARAVIETWATRETMTAGIAPVTQMSECLDRQRRLIPDGDNVDFIEVDREFHTILIRAAGNPIMDRMYETLRARHVPIGVVALERDIRRRHRVIEEHQAIIDGLASGVLDRAEEAVRRHLGATLAMLSRG